MQTRQRRNGSVWAAAEIRAVTPTFSLQRDHLANLSNEPCLMIGSVPTMQVDHGPRRLTGVMSRCREKRRGSLPPRAMPTADRQCEGAEASSADFNHIPLSWVSCFTSEVWSIVALLLQKQNRIRVRLLKRSNTDSSTESPFSKDLKTLEETTFSRANLAVSRAWNVSGRSAAWFVNCQNQSRDRCNQPFSLICHINNNVFKHVLSPST